MDSSPKFYKYRPFKIKRNESILKLDSIIFANIGEMAKTLTIAKKSKPDDGLFEVVTFKHGHKIRLLQKLMKATVDGLDSHKHMKRYEFTVLKDMPIQLDGEVVKVKKGSSIVISSEHNLLRTLI